jgi:hypothetical protein
MIYQSEENQNVSQIFMIDAISGISFNLLKQFGKITSGMKLNLPKYTNMKI